jgi:hypothetical protein
MYVLFPYIQKLFCSCKNNIYLFLTNPCQTEKDILPQPTTRKVYNTNSFAIATILGGPLAAAYMASINFNTFGESNKARYAWATAIFLLLVVTNTAFVPSLDKIPNFIYALLFLFIVQMLVHRFQAKKIRQHVDDGGEVYPISRAIVVGLIFMIALLAIFLGVAYALDSIGVEWY